MAKDVFQELARFYDLPFYTDRQEFYDKVLSYIYASFKIKRIERKRLTEAERAEITKNQNNVLVRLDDRELYPCRKKYVRDISDIKEVWLSLDPDGSYEYLVLRFRQIPKFLKKLSRFNEFFKGLEAYFAHHEAIFKHLELLVSEPSVPPAVIEPVPAKPKPAMNESEVRDKNRSYIQLDVKLLPEKVKLVDLGEKVEKQIIKEYLKRSQGKRNAAARLMGITERMIGYKIRKYRL